MKKKAAEKPMADIKVQKDGTMVVTIPAKYVSRFVLSFKDGKKVKEIKPPK